MTDNNDNSKDLVIRSSELSVCSVVPQLAKDVPIMEAEPEKFTIELSNIIGKLYRYCARHIKEEDETIASIELYKEIKKHFPKLSIEEIDKALFDGLRAESNTDYLELSTRKYYVWLEKYQNSVVRAEVERERKTKNCPPPIGAEDNRRAGINLCCRVFEDYRKGKRDGLFFTPIIKTLKEEGMLEMNGARKDSLRERARIDLLKEMQAKKASFGGIAVSDRTTVKQAIMYLESPSTENYPGNLKVKIDNRVDEIALRDFFDGLIEMGQELKDMFD